jgi:hypothetical protein
VQYVFPINNYQEIYNNVDDDKIIKKKAIPVTGLGGLATDPEARVRFPALPE